MYDPAMVQPMRDELVRAGVKELYTPQEVDAILSDDTKNSLIFINSVCGCAAAQARPGLVASLNNKILPDNVTTVFAGMEKEAVSAARNYFLGYPASSPSLAVFRKGELVHFLERKDFLNQPAESIGKILSAVFDKYCGAEINESVDVPTAESLSSSMEITVKRVKSMLDNGEDFKFLDVREPQEIAIASIKGTTHLDQKLGQEIMDSWDLETPIVFTCHHGNRSAGAAQYFKKHGFRNVFSMRGGIEAWSNEIDPSIPKY